MSSSKPISANCPVCARWPFTRRELWTLVLLASAALPAALALDVPLPFQTGDDRHGHPVRWDAIRLAGAPSVAPDHVTDIAAGSGLEAWAVSTRGTLWSLEATRDGWEASAASLDPPAITVAAINNLDPVGTTIVTGGAGGLIRRSVDGGRSWTEASVARSALVSTVFNDEGTGFMVGPGVVVGHVAEPRGFQDLASWHVVKEVPFSVYAVALHDGSSIAVGGAGAVLTSVDDGSGWEVVWLPDRESLKDVGFAGDSVVVAVGTRGTIMRSENRGRRWTRVVAPTRSHLRGVAFKNASEGIAVGYEGTILRTVNAGRTWTREASGTIVHLLTVDVLSDGRYVVGGWFQTVLVERPGVGIGLHAPNEDP